jgi:LemA protein
MANQLDEMSTDLINVEGRDINVIEKKIPAEIGKGSFFFELTLWLLGIIPGLVFLFMKISARNYFDALQQKIQHNASQIDNYLEQRVQILKNVVGIVEKAVELDKDVMKTVAAVRSGTNLNESNRNEISSNIESAMGKINIAFESYPDLKAHQSLSEAMKQNNYLQREITAAREVYNDTVFKWNADIFKWPTKNIVAARAGFSTRIPYTASRESKEQARATYF